MNSRRLNSEQLKQNNMNALRNKVQLIGHLGGNPESKTFDNGKKVVRFNLATNESYKNSKGELVKETQWHQVVAWEKLADVMEQYLSKGSEVALEGKIVYREYTDSSGAKRYITEIVASEMLMLDKKAN